MADRRFQRVPFQAETRVVANDSAWACRLLNIALKGALLESDQLPIEPGTICDLEIVLPGTGIPLEFSAVLVHHADNRYGFKFLRIDLSTLTHLRKLLELNTGDAECVRKELMVWLEES